MRALRNPIVQFLLLGLLTMAVIAAVTDHLAGRSAEQEALAESRRTNAVLARYAAKPLVTAGVLRSKPGALDVFDRKVRKQLLVGDIERVNFWDESGTLVYSSAELKTGQAYGLDAAHQRVMDQGGTGVITADPASPANTGVPGSHGVVQIFTRFRAAHDQTVLFEGYYSLDTIERRRETIYSSFRWITVGGLVLLLLLVTPLLLVLTRRLTRAAEDRERLLNLAIDASDAERRRIARDLHDSVVQDLAGTGFSVAAVARDPGLPSGARGTLNVAGTSLRDSLKSLRSLLAEIHPPELHSEGLAASLADLTAPAATQGIQASVSVEGAETVSDDRAALVWRVAQEAVRNAMRHARPDTLAVTVRGDGKRLTLEVVDDGVGFTPGQVDDPSSFGLRGLRSLVTDAGGTLQVVSAPGEGTSVRMEVAAQ